MKTLHMTLKKRWFDMILRGEKMEEYREIKPYWFRRLVLTGKDALITPWAEGLKDKKWAARWNFDNYYYGKTFDTVTFTNGYSKYAPRMVVECKGISIGSARAEWSDNWPGEVFIISLGKVISSYPFARINGHITNKLRYQFISFERFPRPVVVVVGHGHSTVRV